MAPVIIAKDLYKCYAGFAPVLRGANIEIMPGEMAAIMGPSGCGKSTMLHILGMLHAPDSGSLEILGQNVLTFNREQTAAFRRGNMGFVMQSSNLFEHSTVFENVEFPLIYENVPQEERWERVIRALELVRLSARVHYRSNRLSGGEQQRVAIARAMVNNPRILLADEPTGALDARTSSLIMENFRRLCHTGGVSMVMVTHDPKMAEYCDSIYTLEEGVLHSKKHIMPQVAPNATENFLNPPKPVVRGAFVASRFPDPKRPDLLAQAGRLNSQHLLSRICSLSSGSFLGNPEGYALPLAVRRIGFWQSFWAISRFFHHARKSQSLWPLWSDLPVHSGPGGGFFSRMRSFACGSLISRFALEDQIEFVYAAGPGNEATSAWVAARLLRLPFAFAATGNEMADFGRDWLIKARDASFVICRSHAGKERLKELLPDIADDKILLLRDPLPVLPGEDEGAMPAAPDQPLELLAVDDGNGINYRLLFATAKMLRSRKVAFHLKIAAKKKFASRLRCRLTGLSKQTRFLGHVPPDRLAELYKTTDIFLACLPRPKNNAVVEMPVSLACAMAFGCAVIAPAWPALAEIINTGKNGLLYHPAESKTPGTMLCKLASNSSLRVSLGEAAKTSMLALAKEAENSQALARRIDLATGDNQFARM